VNFLIDTNICSAYIKGNRTVWSRFLQHAGGMALSVVTVGELWTWAKRAKTRPQARNAVAELIELLDVIEIDFQVALRFGELRAQLLDAGKPMPDMDMLIAATALVYDLTLVTHNTNDFQPVAGLSLADWFSE
jgi:tRNA(fMet)-specific endonuclease VapC